MPPQASKITVLIVDDIADTRKNLARLLQFEPDMEVAGDAGTARQAIVKARELHPNVVIMDIDLPDMSGVAATEVISKEVPGTAVIMVSMLDDNASLRSAMQAGAREFLVRPFTGSDLAAVIRRVDALEANRRTLMQAAARVEGPAPKAAGNSLVIAVFSPKGGVGCTTLAVNLAVALRQQANQRVALIDGDLRFGDVGAGLNILGGKTISDVAAAINQLDEELLVGNMHVHGSGVHVLPGPTRPELGDLVTVEAVKRIIATARIRYDFVVIDAGAAFDDHCIAALDASDRILLVVNLDFACVKNARLFLEVTEALHYAPERVTLVANKVEDKTAISVNDVARNVGRAVPWTVENGRQVVSQAVNQGVPFVTTNREAQVTRDVQKIAAALCGAAEAEQEQERVAKPARTASSTTRGFAFLGKRG